MGWRQDWRQATWWLGFAVLAFSWGDLLFGIDTAAFSALQVLPAWRRDFATYDERQGAYVIPSWQTSIMNSVVFIGSFAGCASFEPICKRYGYKVTIYVAGVFQIVAVTVELTAKNWQVFTVGRVIGYVGVGLVESASPGYCSEISPAGLRGFMSGSMTALVTTGNTIGVGVCIPFREEIRRIGWMVPVGIQYLPAVGILAMVPWCPESPRWLIEKGRDAEALKALNKLRRQHEVDAGSTAAEVEAIKLEIEYVKSQDKGRWIDLFAKKYIKRTAIVVGLFFFYQTTGGQFANVYGPTFYQQLGLGPELFTYQTVGQGVGIAVSIIGIILIDRIGRRPPILFGACMLFVCNILIGTLGPKTPNISKTEQGVVIASIMLLLSGLKLSFQCGAFLLASEIGGNRMRKKFMGFGTTIDVIFRFVFTFCVPFLIKEPLNMGARFGFVMAVIAGFSIAFVYFMVPETMGRALEEMDELFAMKLWPWKWRNAKTTGVGAQVANAERGRVAVSDDKDDLEKNLEIQHTESVPVDMEDSNRRRL